MLAPYARGGKIGLFGAGVGKTVFIQKLINNVAKVDILCLLGLMKKQDKVMIYILK